MLKFIPHIPSFPVEESIQSISKLDTVLTDEKKSPFAWYNGETHRQMTVDKMTSCSEAEWLVEQGIINNMDKAILTLINELVFSTSLQIHTFLALTGINLQLDEVKQSLVRLKKKSFIKAIEFCSTTGKSAFKVYCLGYHGINLIKAQGKKLLGATRFINEKPSSEIKKQLATNQLLSQLLLRYGGAFQNSTLFQTKQAFLWTSTFMDKTGKVYFIESVRRCSEWQQQIKQIKEKANRCASIIDSYRNLDTPLPYRPTLLIAAEDAQHVLELQSVIKTTRLRKKDVLYSYDSLIYNDIKHAFFK